MNVFAELREMPETRRLTLIYLIAAALWIVLLFLVYRISDTSREIRTNLNASDQILNSAINRPHQRGPRRRRGRFRESR